MKIRVWIQSKFIYGISGLSDLSLVRKVLPHWLQDSYNYDHRDDVDKDKDEDKARRRRIPCQLFIHCNL